MWTEEPLETRSVSTIARNPTMQMIRPAVVLMAFVGVFVPRLLQAASPPQEGIDPRGKPSTPNNTLMIYVWCDDSAWHVKSRGIMRQPHRVHGTIRVVEGKVTELKGFENMEVGKKHIRDVGNVNGAKDLITFTFAIGGKSDDFHFNVDEKATELVFTFFIDGEKHLDKIAIGRAKAHPTASPFTLPAYPDKRQTPPQTAPQ